MTKEEEEETGTASRGGEWKNREANDIVKVHDIPEKMTAANSPMSILCSALSAKSFTSITFKCEPASHPQT